jgi:hypothetical protein
MDSLRIRSAPQSRLFAAMSLIKLIVFGFASGQIGERFEYKGGRQRFDPPQNPFFERMQVQTDSLFDWGTYSEHEWNPFFINIGAWLEPYTQNEPH